MTAKICEDVEVKNLRKLAAGVCLSALEDAKSPDPVKSLDAVYWLTSPDFPYWAEWAGLPFADVWQLLTGGVRVTRTKTKGGRYVRRAETV
jgi:hypothetical protein